MIDINDRIDLSPEIWGHNGWFFLDSICLSYPLNPSNEMKENCKSFFIYYLKCYHAINVEIILNNI